MPSTYVTVNELVHTLVRDDTHTCYVPRNESFDGLCDGCESYIAQLDGMDCWFRQYTTASDNDASAVIEMDVMMLDMALEAADGIRRGIDARAEGSPWAPGWEEGCEPF